MLCRSVDDWRGRSHIGNREHRRTESLEKNRASRRSGLSAILAISYPNFSHGRGLKEIFGTSCRITVASYSHCGLGLKASWSITSSESTQTQQHPQSAVVILSTAVRLATRLLWDRLSYAHSFIQL
ncbi:hypothetical protein HN011_005398 [Eciton burchellii]|nr:hypothetical protein HN011_005398 [Eciton burchellii]